MAYSHVAHDCIIGNKTVFANCAALGGHVEIGDWVILGGLTAVHQFVKIGAHAFIGGSPALTRDVPPYVMAAGNPAVPHCGELGGPQAPRLQRGADSQHQRTPTASVIART